MNLAARLRAIADLLDILDRAGLTDQAVPIDDNGTLEMTQNAYDFCLEFAEGRQLLQILQSDGMSLFVHEEIVKADDELSILFEV